MLFRSGIEFGRQAQGGRSGQTANSDLLVTRVASKGKSKAEGMTFRFHIEVMQRLRWMIGDYIKVIPEDGAEKWTIQRVTPDKGIKISPASGKGCRHGRAAFTVLGSLLDEIFKDGRDSFTATLCDDQGGKAVFIRD